jgi:hypothetical protein
MMALSNPLHLPIFKFRSWKAKLEPKQQITMLYVKRPQDKYGFHCRRNHLLDEWSLLNAKFPSHFSMKGWLAFTWMEIPRITITSSIHRSTINIIITLWWFHKYAWSMQGRNLLITCSSAIPSYSTKHPKSNLVHHIYTTCSQLHGFHNTYSITLIQHYTSTTTSMPKSSTTSTTL